MGGRSIEREVSFNSGRTICDHLDAGRYAVIPIFQTDTGSLFILPQHFLHRGKISDFLHRLEAEAERLSWDELKKRVDFVYIAQHGRYGEDGILQGMLEVLSIPYLGTKVLGSAVGMDKATQKQILASAGVDVARGIVIQPTHLADLSPTVLLEQLARVGVQLPVIVKPVHEGSSLGITLVKTPEALVPAITLAATADARRTQPVIVEEALEGMEFVCVSLEKIKNVDGIVSRTWFSLPLTEVVIEKESSFFDYEQKYMPGRALKITPARCTPETAERIVAACHQATAVLGFSTLSRIDGFATKDGRIVLIDPNTLTGMAPSTFLFNQAAEIGMSHTDLINFMIENELHAYGLLQDSNSADSQGVSMETAPDKKIRVAVLLGGDSNEREVSLESGRNVCYKLSPQRYDVLPIFVNDNMELFHVPQKLLIKNTTRLIAEGVTPEMHLEWSDLPKIADFVFIGLHGGRGENGSVQGALEMLGLPYNGPGVLASALCINKFKTNAFLRSKGFATPQSLLLEKATWLALNNNKETYLTKLLEQHSLTLPLIVKPHDDGCSVMVSKATTLPELIDILDAYFSSNKTVAMLEEMILGVELTVGILGNENPQALPPSLAVAKKGILTQEEKFLPGEGENQTPAPLPSTVLALVQQTVRDAFVAIGCVGYSRIDCFYQSAEVSPTGNERVVLLEFNTVPALTPATCIFHQAAEVGISPMEFIDAIVKLGLEHHQKIIVTPASCSTTAVDETVFKPIPEEALQAAVEEPIKPETKRKSTQDESASLEPAQESFTMSLF